MKESITCSMCGKFVRNPANGQIYCKKCAEWVNKNNRDAINAKRKSKKKENKKPSLSEIMHEATKEGLQYAAYCRKHGLY